MAQNATSNRDIPKQQALLDKLLLSSAFTQEEVDAHMRWRKGPRDYHDYAGKIQWALSRIAEEKQKREDSEKRKAEWHARKGA